ncbi:carbohydrate binding domain-containing protein [Candidatus Wolfebacteria bacterium]|nr:carbohydrate binding domain-containing protein [Candidatus Wolfebacteria bacterium]
MILNTRKMVRAMFLGITILSVWGILGLNVSSAATISKPTQSLGLVGYWSFDVGKGGAKAVDMSGRGNNGTLTNMNTTAAWVAGKIGQALNFDGVDDYVNVGDPASGILDFGSGQDFTVAAWVKSTMPAVLNKYPIFVAKDNDAGGSRQAYVMSLHQSTGTLWFFQIYVSGTGYSVNGRTNIADGNWHFVVGVRQGSTLYSYEDGTLANSAAGSSGSISNATSLGIGLDIGNDSSNCCEYSGQVDDVRVYNRALSAEEIKRLYRQTSPQMNASQANKLRQGLVGMWTFDGNDMSGNTAIDRSGNGNNGTLTNGPQKTIGKIGQALNFDGVDDYVDAGNNSSLNDLGASTVSAWIYPKGWGENSYGRIFDSDSCCSSWYIFHLDNDGTAPDKTLRFNVDFDSTDLTRSGAANLITLNQWQYVVVTWDGAAAASGVKFYVNGVESSSYGQEANGVTSRVTGSPSLALIGNRTNADRTFKGLIDDVRIYNRALTEAEIRQLYKAGSSFHPNTTNKSTIRDGLVGQWTFDGADMGTTSARDASGNSNTGWLINGAKKTIGRVGQALSFDGSNDYVSLGNVGSVQNISYWVKPSVNRYSLSLSGSGSPKRYLLNNGLYNGTNTATRYINGATPTGESLGSEKLTNGTFETGSASPWDANVQGGASGSVGITSSGPYAGTYALDFNITAGGTATYMAQARHNSNFSLTSGTLYKVQFAAKASSAKNGLNVTHQLSVSPWTGSGLTYTYDVTTSWVMHTYYFYSTQTASNIMTFFGAGNLGAFNLYLDNISIKPVTSVGDVTNGVWNFVSVNLDSTVSADDAYLATVGGEYFQGVLDDVRVYNRALSPDEIKRIYNMGR